MTIENEQKVNDRNRVTTEQLLFAANWVRENIHQLLNQEHTLVAWRQIIHEGSGILLSTTTARKVLESAGIQVGVKPTANALENRVEQLAVRLEQVVARLDAMNTQRVLFPEGGAK